MDLIDTLPKKSEKIKPEDRGVLTGDFDPVSGKIAHWMHDNYNYAISFAFTNRDKFEDLTFEDGIQWLMNLLINDLLEHQLDLKHEIEDFLIPLLKLDK